MLRLVSVLKAGPSLRSVWRDGDEKPKQMGLIGDTDELVVDGPSGVEPILRSFMALPLASPG
jgi:hypothetical protein